MNTHIVIHSHNRDNITGTKPENCTITLNKKITAECAELSYFMCPNTFYNITAANNTFLLDASTITIDPGCYSLTQLFTEVLTLLPLGSNILFNDVLNKLEFTFTAAHTLDFSGSKSWLVFGFLPKAYASATSFISDNPPKIYQTLIYVETNLANNIVSDLGYHCSFSVPITVNKGEMIYFHNRTMFSSRPKVRDNEIRNIQVILKDEYNQVLQAVGDFSLILAINEKKNINDSL